MPSNGKNATNFFPHLIYYIYIIYEIKFYIKETYVTH